MKKVLLILFITSPLTWAEEGNADMHHHSHDGHLHDTMVNGKNLEVDVERFDKFMEGIVDMNIAIVSVQGMVCDFCARGIEKAFLKDSSVSKVDVDLDQIQYLFDQKNEQGDFTILRQDYWLDVLLEVEMELYFCDGPMLRSYISKDRAVPARWYSVRTSLPELLKSTDQNEEDLVEIEPRWTE